MSEALEDKTPVKEALCLPTVSRVLGIFAGGVKLKNA